MKSPEIGLHSHQPDSRMVPGLNLVSTALTVVRLLSLSFGLFIACQVAGRSQEVVIRSLSERYVGLTVILESGTHYQSQQEGSGWIVVHVPLVHGEANGRVECTTQDGSVVARMLKASGPMIRQAETLPLYTPPSPIPYIVGGLIGVCLLGGAFYYKRYYFKHRYSVPSERN